MKHILLPLSAMACLGPLSAQTVDSYQHSESTATVPNAQARLGSWLLLPSSPQKLQPYLAGLFTLSDNCLEPAPSARKDALSEGAQAIKSAAAEIGLRYDLTLTYNYGSISPAIAGQQKNFSSTNNELWASWTLAKSADQKQGIFLMLEADLGQGFNFNENTNGAQGSLGSISNPQSGLRGGNGVFIPHLSLGYSGWDGQFVAMVGTLDLTNFLDQNTYSADWNGNLLNLSFNFNPCLPLTWGNWGYMTAWQPHENFYAMYATTGSNAELNHNPFQYISSKYWVHLAELGYISKDFLGMGAGTYRFLYTITNEASKMGAGAAINIQQKLGANSNVGFFTRMGYMDQDAASITGVQAAITCGFVLEAPFSNAGWGSQANNDQVALGLLWERAADSEEPYEHRDEYGIELSAVVQLTPTFFIQPDIQYIFNPIHANNGNNGAFVFQVQSTFRF